MNIYRAQNRGVKRHQPEYIDASTQTKESRQGVIPMFTCIMFSEKGEAATQINHFDLPQQSQATPLSPSIEIPMRGFRGFESLASDRVCTTHTGCTLRILHILVRILLPDFPHRIISIQNCLVLTLMKIKLDLSYTAVGDYFNIDRRVAQRIFSSVLEFITFRTKSLIRWPTREEVNKDLPEVFRKGFPNTISILDCTEIPIEVPSSLYIRNHCYSMYKGTHTIKYLIAVAPNGTTTFISKGYGGRASDTHITNTCGILSLFKPGDLVMCDKGFPKIQVNKVVTVIPPRAKPDQKQFTPKQMKTTREIASARVHVERKIQRLKIFKVLKNQMDFNLLPYADQIMHLIAVITNLTPPIIAEE